MRKKADEIFQAALGGREVVLGNWEAGDVRCRVIKASPDHRERGKW